MTETNKIKDEKWEWEFVKDGLRPICSSCGSFLIPHFESKNPLTHKWDKHSFWCRCIGKDIIIHID